MAAPQVQCFGNLEQLSRAAAERLVASARAALAARGRFVVALSGGSTPRALFELLAASPFKGQVDWGRVQFFWGDERPVPPDHPDSNYHMARETLLGQLNLAPGQVH